MSDYFPTDVRVRIDGSQADAKAHLGEARGLLFRALLLQEQNDTLPIYLTKKISEDAFISVLLVDGQKIVRIVTHGGPIDQPLVETPETEQPLLPGSFGLYMLSGVIREGKIVSVTDGSTTTLKLRDFAPSANCALKHNVPTGYNDNTKLAIPATVGDSQYAHMQASRYSGAMKRVVQYVQGLGKIADATPAYLTSSGPVVHPVLLQYNYMWDTTHGIYKAGDKNHWLIEISQTRGVLAMPLPLVPTVLPDGSSIAVASAGDTAMTAAIAEFGGLPSGETFPTGAKLTTAIANGRVLQLLMPGDLDPFYASGNPHTPESGWAFSESGIRAYNTKHVVRYLRSDDTKQSLVGEHWEIKLNLSTHTSTPLGTPVGTGSATLGLISAGRFNKRAANSIYVSYGEERLSKSIASSYFGTSTMDLPDVNWHGITDTIKLIGDERLYWGATISAFFDGEAPQKIKWCPEVVHSAGSYSEAVVAPAPDGYFDAPYTSLPLSLAGPWYGTTAGSDARGSPAAFVGTSVDLRKLVGNGSAVTSPAHGTISAFTLDQAGYIHDALVEYAASHDPITKSVGYTLPGTPGDPVYPLAGAPAIALFVDTPDCPPARWTYTNGSPQIGFFYRTQCSIAILPAFCRESYVVYQAEWYEAAPGWSSFESTQQCVGYFTGLGVVTPSCPQNPLMFYVVYGTDTTSPIYFGASVNAGATTAYVMTDGLQYAMAPSHPIARVGMPSGSDTMTPDKTIFIGGY